MSQSGRDTDDVAQVAWLYHVGGLGQEEVSQRLGISRFKVLRLLADAREQGLVRISISHETTGTLALADALTARFGLTEARVAPMPGGLDEEVIARRAVGIVAAGFLGRIARDGAVQIGVGWGRTMAAMTQAVTGLRNPDLCFVSLMGSMARTAETSPFDVCTRLASLTGGSAMFLPAPFLCDSEADCLMVLRQRLVRETLQAARAAPWAIISLGDCSPEALLSTSGILTAEETDELQAVGAVADSTGKFFMADGSLAPTDLNRRAPSISLDDLRATDVTLLTAGANKAVATRAMIRAGVVDRLILDENAARALLALEGVTA